MSCLHRKNVSHRVRHRCLRLGGIKRTKIDTDRTIVNLVSHGGINYFWCKRIEGEGQWRGDKITELFFRVRKKLLKYSGLAALFPLGSLGATSLVARCSEVAGLKNVLPPW